MSLPTFVLEEFRKSAIPDRLTLANVQWVEGESAIAILAENALTGRNSHGSTRTAYVTVNDRRLLDKYEFAREGMWVVHGQDIDGNPGEVACCKPVTPRKARAEGFGETDKTDKIIKYETPASRPATPILTYTPWIDGLQIAKRFKKEKEYVKRISQAFEGVGNSPGGDSRETQDEKRGANLGSQKPAAGAVHEGAGLGDRQRGCIKTSGLLQTLLPNSAARLHSDELSPLPGGRDARELGQTNNLLSAEVKKCLKEGRIDRLFWRFLQSNNTIPICIVEGWKKASCLIGHGIPAIALRGVCNWHLKGTDELHEKIAHFATKGRRFVICFDQDSKPKTVLEVNNQINKLAKVLESKKCKVSVATWDGKLGKGIDDAIYRVQSEKGEAPAQAWVDKTFEDALPYKCWKRNNRVPKKLELINSLNTLSYAVERATEGEYLPQLPTLLPGTIHVLSATMNSGKTVRIGADWVKSAVAANWRVLVLSPLNSLGQQTAQDWNLPHIHDYALDGLSQGALWSDVASRNGIVMCFDSLHRLPQWFFERNGEPCPVLLVLDEATQGISHLLSGATLGSRWADIRSRFTSIATHCSKHGAIVLAEDGLPDRAIDFVRKVAAAGSDRQFPVRVFTHERKSDPWDCTFWDGNPSGFRSALLAAIESRENPILYVTTSKQEGRRLERKLLKSNPELKIVRIDSDTNQKGKFRDFFTNPNEWLHLEKSDIVILTPSGRTGLSIEGGVLTEDAYFGSVWGHFTSLDTDSALQLSGRYRPAVPRNIYCPNFIQTNSDEAIGASWAIKARWKQNAEGLGRILENPSEIERTARELEIDEASLEFLSKSVAVAGAQKSIARDALIERLKASGHQISVTNSVHSKELATEWRKIQDELDREDAALAAGLIIALHHTKDWAINQLNSPDVDLETRLRAQKVLWRDEFPGMRFDDPEECYEAIYRKYGQMMRGVKSQAQTENPSQSKLLDSGKIEAAIKDGALHRLPKSAARAILLSKLGVLELLDGEVYSNTDPRCLGVQERALEFAGEIRYWLNLNVNEDQTAVEICHKLLRRFGFEIDKEDRPGAIEVVGRPGKRGDDRGRVYRVNPDYSPIRTRLLEAYRRKLSEASHTPVSTISNSDSTYIEIVDTKPKIPINEELEGVVGMLDEFSRDGLLERDGMIDLTQHLSPDEKRQVWAELTPETRNRLRAIAS